MSINSSLEHFIYRAEGDPQADGLAYSAGLTEAACRTLLARVSLEPTADMPDAVGLFADPASDRSLLVLGHYPAYRHVILLPGALLPSVSGSIMGLLEMLDHPAAVPSAVSALPPLDLPLMPTWTADKRLGLLQKVLAQPKLAQMSTLLAMVGAALSTRGLAIRRFPPDVDARVALVQALLLLLPSPARSALTFSTAASPLSTAQIIFVEESRPTERCILDFATDDSEGDDLPEEVWQSPYLQRLHTLWVGRLEPFIGHLRALDLLGAALMPQQSVAEGLALVAERHQLDAAVENDSAEAAEIPLEKLQAALTGNSPPAGELRLRYLERVLMVALRTRTAAAVELVAQSMDADAALDAALETRLHTALHDEPDAVYAFVRAHLAQGSAGEAVHRWLPRLQAAARESLRVAINDGDSEILISWLRLIAREPAAYQLHDVLQEGMSAAVERAYADGGLGYQLLVLVSRRLTGWLDRLLDDAALVAALPDPLRAALQMEDSAAFASTLLAGREIALALLSRAEARRFRGGFRPEQIDFLWDLKDDEACNILPEAHRPQMILARLAADGVGWLSLDAVERLLVRAVAADHLVFLRGLARGLAQDAALFPRLALALHKSGADSERLLTLIGQMVGDETLTAQQALDTYLDLVEYQGWARASLPVLEQAARLLQSMPTLQVSSAVLWRLLQTGADARSEWLTRSASRRLLVQIEALADDTELIDAFAQLYDLLAPMPAMRSALLTQWRDWAHTQPAARLQSLLQVLNGRRSLDDPREILYSLLAVRKLLGKRTLEEFAYAISTTYALLQAFAAAFNPETRQGMSLDTATIRAELDARESELTPDERKVLAKNLRELAQLVMEMAEHRSRTGLMRRGDDSGRGLYNGEQIPQSALDTLKWLSGYFDGRQNKEEPSEE